MAALPAVLVAAARLGQPFAADGLGRDGNIVVPAQPGPEKRARRGGNDGDGDQPEEAHGR